MAAAHAWPDDRVAQLEELWRGGLTYRAIAQRLGVTRSAVSGQLRRRGLVYLDASSSTYTPAPAPAIAAAVVSKTAKRWDFRRFGECAFPVAGSGRDTMACCAKTDDGATYCPSHRAVMYQPRVAKANTAPRPSRYRPVHRG